MVTERQEINRKGLKAYNYVVYFIMHLKIFFPFLLRWYYVSNFIEPCRHVIHASVTVIDDFWMAMFLIIINLYAKVAMGSHYFLYKYVIPVRTLSQ